nr:hypothetical protein [Neobacillus novalis]
MSTETLKIGGLRNVVRSEKPENGTSAIRSWSGALQSAVAYSIFLRINPDTINLALVTLKKSDPSIGANATGTSFT